MTLARSALRDPRSGVVPVGFLDDDPSLAGGTVAGLRVYGGLASMAHAVARTGAQTLLITMPAAPGLAVRRIVEAALALRLEVRTVPSMTKLLDGSIDANRARRVRVEDLLRRPMVTEHAAGVEEIIRDRTILITGGGGSIGSELARQVFALGPRRLILVDRAESPLYLVQRDLETQRGHGKGSGELRIHLANVASRASMERLVAAEAPNVIFHAAAYKHVPMMEEHPSDATHVNIGGTLVMLDAAAAAGVERFVFVSTDKAVRPSSVMGASKRIAEMLVADTARRTGRPYVSVRFGNVLGSTGSVVPIFQEQLENGEPLTITHPDMTRFFMTIPEASWLILDAAALGRNGDLFVLDMGEPVRIMDLARDLVAARGTRPRAPADRDGRPPTRREAPRGALLRCRAGGADRERESPAGDRATLVPRRPGACPAAAGDGHRCRRGSPPPRAARLRPWHRAAGREPDLVSRGCTHLPGRRVPVHSTGPPDLKRPRPEPVPGADRLLRMSLDHALVLPWFLPGAVIALVVGIVCSGPVSRTLRVGRRVAWFIVVILGIILAATMTPQREALAYGARGPDSCDFSRVGLAPISELLRFNDTGLNVLMFIPLGTTIGLLPRSRRTAAVVIAAIALPFAIEAAQLLLPVLDRACESADVVDNLTGLVLGLGGGVAAGWLGRSLARRPG